MNEEKVLILTSTKLVRFIKAMKFRSFRQHPFGIGAWIWSCCKWRSCWFWSWWSWDWWVLGGVRKRVGRLRGGSTRCSRWSARTTSTGRRWGWCTASERPGNPGLLPDSSAVQRRRRRTIEGWVWLPRLRSLPWADTPGLETGKFSPFFVFTFSITLFLLILFLCFFSFFVKIGI